MVYASHVTDHANEILPSWLYLGGERNAKQIWTTNPHKFTHVVCVAEEVPGKSNSNEQFGGGVSVSVVCGDDSIIIDGGDTGDCGPLKKSMVHGICAYHVSIRDLPGEELTVFSEIADEIHRIRSEHSGDSLKLLVHCVQGISRSTTAVLAYLMKYQGMRLKDAYHYVRARRSIARPRKEFVEELQRMEMKLFGVDKPSLSVEDTTAGTTTINLDPRM